MRNDVAAVQALFQKNVVPCYARFELAFSHGAGSYLWEVTGKRYLDLGGGIAVCCLGHANLEITETLRGDPVAAENYLQHAEHYLRSIQEKRGEGRPGKLDNPA